MYPFPLIFISAHKVVGCTIEYHELLARVREGRANIILPDRYPPKTGVRNDESSLSTMNESISHNAAKGSVPDRLIS